jgi:predicted DNA-binding transcriptional regulator YafY
MGMTKYDRLLHILNLLRSRRNLNAEKLAEECGVTERSIYRDIISLSEANVPIYYDNGYRLASDNFLPPLNFDFEEYTCLRLALESSPLRQTGRYKDVLKRIRGKVDARLSEIVKQQRRSAVDTTHIEIAVSQPTAGFEKRFRLLEEAIGADRCVDLDYESVSSGRSRRVVEPYFIVFRARAFYFVGFCRERQDFRTFRLDRIVKLQLLEEQFQRRRDISAHDYFEGSWEVFKGEPVEVVVEFSGAAARVVTSSVHHATEQLEELDSGRVRYSARVSGLAEIKRWIAGFGAEATVISPDELRQDLGRTGEFYVRVYADQES